MTEDETRSPSAGGCWICKRGNGFEDPMAFDIEFDTFYHESCLDDTEADSILEYERDNDGKHTIE